MTSHTAQPESHTEVPLIKSISSIAIDAPISCLSFAPRHSNIIVLGTYQLHESQDQAQSTSPQQSRSGSLRVFELIDDCLHHCLVQKTDYGVLDLKFSPKDDDVFAVAASSGTIDIFHLSILENALLTRIHTFEIFDAFSLVLSLDWCPIVGSETRLALSSSDGRLAVIVFSSEQSCCQLEAHSLEAWCVSWDNTGHETFYSGGDDSALYVHTDWRLRLEKCVSRRVCQAFEKGEDEEKYVPFSRDLKVHGAGVTAIIPIGKDANDDAFIITGSYDEHLRILKRQTGKKTWQTAAYLQLGGGVWRIKLIDKQAHDGVIRPGTLKILASCMHAGPRIVQVELSQQGSWSLKLVAQFVEHESMNYASDVAEAFPVSRHGTKTIVSSSFYDKKLCVWRLEET